jgi:GT2 family glycosyltransferase
MKPISVVIVSWNAQDHLRACLASLRETGESVIQEVIVVDNASDDGSPEMVKKEFPEVTLIQAKENLGFARANNLGLKTASGDFLALINSDTVVHPGCFQRLVSFFECQIDVGLVGPKVMGNDGKLQRTCRRLPTVWNTLCRALALDTAFSGSHLFSGREMRHWSQENEAEVEVLSGCFWMARRAAVEKVGGLDERFFFYAEDVDWCKRFRNAGWKVFFVPAATATHFGGASSARAPLHYSIEMLRANLAYWKKHFGTLGKMVFYFLTVIHHALRFMLLGLRRLVSKESNDEANLSYQRSLSCLCWLVTGKEVE